MRILSCPRMLWLSWLCVGVWACSAPATQPAGSALEEGLDAGDSADEGALAPDAADATDASAGGAVDAAADVATFVGDASRPLSGDASAGNSGGSGAGEGLDRVDGSSLDGKLMFGYQGWFTAPGDGSRFDRWRHWSADQRPGPANVKFDIWPDLRELDQDELFDTDFAYADGSNAGLYSAYKEKTVRRHFRWMREHGLDGVFLQQFVNGLREGTPIREFRDRVTANVRAGAEAHGRVFAIMYDISGAPEDSFVETLKSHWRSLVDEGTVGSGRYLRHRGRPLVAIWGLGFDSRPGRLDQANALLSWFQSEAPAAYRASVLGGVPGQWRTLDGDSKQEPGWAGFYRRLDVISPWSVGRYADDAGVENFQRTRLVPDLVEARNAGADYLPVVWPGFSWANLKPGSVFNQIPRRGGRFWWAQFHGFTTAGASMIYGAMFDEVDEATAMYKLAETVADVPTTGRFLTLDADGEQLPSDWYLRLAGEATRILRGERAPTASRPFSPPTPTCDPPHTELRDGRCLPSCGHAGGNNCDPAACRNRPVFEAYDCEVCCRTEG